MTDKLKGVKLWRKTVKKRMVDSLGGGCCCCGYNNYNGAIDIHHLEPEKKTISFSKVIANPTAWPKIVEELRGCVALCKICHSEHHAGLLEIPDDAPRFNEEYAEYEKDTGRIPRGNCPVCGNQKKYITTKTCSSACAGKLSGKVDWDSFDLIESLDRNGGNREAVGRELGVTGAAVKKRMSKLNMI